MVSAWDCDVVLTSGIRRGDGSDVEEMMCVTPGATAAILKPCGDEPKDQSGALRIVEQKDHQNWVLDGIIEPLNQDGKHLPLDSFL